MPDDLSLLLKIRGDASSGKAAVSETRAALASLRTQSGGDFKAIEQAGVQAFESIGKGLNVFLVERLPLLGGAFLRVSENLKGLTESAEESSGAIAGMAGPLGIAVVGIAAMTAAAVLLSKELIDVTVSTAEWEGKLLDLSQQTGISVETLNSLQIAAEATGVSIEAVVASLGIFQKNLEAAQDESTKQAAAFKQLKVETNNTEEALRQTLEALDRMPEGFQQTALALELFGRGGKSVLAILKETGGDIDSTVARLGELGAVTTQQAEEAKKFNDTLKELGILARGAGAIIGREMLPVLQEVLESLEKNKDAVALFAHGIADLTELISKPLEGALGALQSSLDQLAAGWLAAQRAMMSYYVGWDAALKSTAGGPDKFAGVTGRTSGQSMFAGLTGAIAGIEPAKAAAGGSSADPLAKYQSILNSTINALDQFGHKSEEVKVKDQLVAAGIDKLTGSLKIEADLIARVALANARLIDAKRELAKFDEEKKKGDEALAALQTQSIINIQEARGLTDDYKVAIDRVIESLVGYTAAEKEAIKAQLDKNAETERTLQLTRQRIVLEQTLIDRLERERAVTDQIKARLQGIDLAQGDETRARRVGVTTQSSEIDKLYQSIHDNLSGSKQTAALAGLDALTEGFQGLGQAIGSAVQAWVLYGNSGTNIRKITAEILAGIAQQAAVKSVFELAEGFAALFLNPAEAAAHFTSSAIYAGVAGVAALAGRGVAGASFANQSTTASTGSTAGTGSSTTNQTVQPVVLGSQRVEVVHKIVPPPGWGHTVLVSALNSNDPAVNRAIGRERG